MGRWAIRIRIKHRFIDPFMETNDPMRNERRSQAVKHRSDRGGVNGGWDLREIAHPLSRASHDSKSTWVLLWLGRESVGKACPIRLRTDRTEAMCQLAGWLLLALALKVDIKAALSR